MSNTCGMNKVETVQNLLHVALHVSWCDVLAAAVQHTLHVVLQTFKHQVHRFRPSITTLFDSLAAAFAAAAAACAAAAITL